MAPRGDSTPSEPDSGRYTERLTVPWWWWLGAAALAAALAAEVWLGAAGLHAWLPFALLLPATVGGLWWLGRLRVAVAGAELLVDDARLPVRFVADVIPIDAAGKRELLGPGADPLAFVVQRPWIGGAVQVLLDDPADPTPYWVVSSRDPVRLAQAVMAARDADGRGVGGARSPAATGGTGTPDPDSGTRTPDHGGRTPAQGS